jgi:hypothetical protein
MTFSSLKASNASIASNASHPNTSKKQAAGHELKVRFCRNLQKSPREFFKDSGYNILGGRSGGINTKLKFLLSYL